MWNIHLGAIAPLIIQAERQSFIEVNKFQSRVSWMVHSAMVYIHKTYAIIYVHTYSARWNASVGSIIVDAFYYLRCVWKVSKLLSASLQILHKLKFCLVWGDPNFPPTFFVTEKNDVCCFFRMLESGLVLTLSMSISLRLVIWIEMLKPASAL